MEQLTSHMNASSFTSMVQLRTVVPSAQFDCLEALTQSLHNVSLYEGHTHRNVKRGQCSHTHGVRNNGLLYTDILDLQIL